MVKNDFNYDAVTSGKSGERTIGEPLRHLLDT